MMKTLSSLIVLATIAAAAVGQDAPAESNGSVDLSPRWKAGQSSTYRLTRSEQRVIHTELIDAPPQITAEPHDETSTEVMTATIRWAVTEAGASGGGTATLTIQEMAIEITDPEGGVRTVTIDKADEQTKPWQEWIAAIAGKPITYRVDGTGRITGVEGYKAIADAMKTPERYDEEYFRNIALDLAMLTGGEPGRKVGQTWTHESTSDHLAGEIATRSTYELASVGPVAGIDVAVVSRVDAMKLTPGERTPTAKLTESSESAQLMFDTSRGEIVGSNSDRVVEVSVETKVETPRGDLTVLRVIRESVNTQVIRTGEE